MRKFLLPVLFLGLLLTGCADQGPAADQPYDFLDTSRVSQEEMAALTQEIGQTVTEEGITVTVLQTISDPMTLYVTYNITYPEGMSPDAYQCEDAVLEGPDGPFPDVAASIPMPGPTAEQTGTYYSQFLFPEPTLEPGMELSLQFHVPYYDEERSGMTSTNHAVTWTTATDAPLTTMDLLDDSGAVRGHVSLSPITLCAWVDDLDAVLDTEHIPIHALDAQGEDIAAGNSLVHREDGTLWLAANPALSLDEIAAVQVGPLTGQMP